MKNVSVSKYSNRAIKIVRVYEIKGDENDYAEVEVGRIVGRQFKPDSLTFLKLASIKRWYKPS